MYKISLIFEFFLVDLTNYSNIFAFKAQKSKINKPLIINGGCGQPSHMKDAIELGADACMGGSIFFFSRYSYSDIKKFLFDEKVNIRI